ncbi:diguanylate cyclase domain-containing protein [Acaryochloris marina]|uniref:diguanylate cyclase domain-containing protein n=1 Tax=Acaryochloris marina TaxID=155978 RepID=UPI0008FFAD8C|nr:diguanylate cyclase [Acaryochloris marina]
MRLDLTTNQRYSNVRLHPNLSSTAYFKIYSDTHGHLQGDLCLSRVTFTIQQCLKRLLAGRYSGEEFSAYLDSNNAISSFLPVLGNLTFHLGVLIP